MASGRRELDDNAEDYVDALSDAFQQAGAPTRYHAPAGAAHGKIAARSGSTGGAGAAGGRRRLLRSAARAATDPRVSFADEGRLASVESGEGGTDFQPLRINDDAAESSLQKVTGTFFPPVEVISQEQRKPLSRQKARPFASTSTFTSPATISSAASSRGAMAPGGAAARVREGISPPEAPSVPLPTSVSSSSDAGPQGAAAGEDERERRRAELRVREAELRVEEAEVSPCPLEEQLRKAVAEGRLSDVRRLVASGADVNCRGPFATTPLLWAFYGRMNADVISLLLQRGADVNAVDSSGYSALHWAAMNDLSGRCVELLVSAGADANARNLCGEAPLHWAALRGNTEAMRPLLGAGAGRDLKPWSGAWKNQTPFDLASSPDARDLLRP